MYAFSVALAMNKIATELKPPGQTHYIAQVGWRLGGPGCQHAAWPAGRHRCSGVVA